LQPFRKNSAGHSWHAAANVIEPATAGQDFSYDQESPPTAQHFVGACHGAELSVSGHAGNLSWQANHSGTDSVPTNTTFDPYHPGTLRIEAAQPRKEMVEMTKLKGKCFCGVVEIEVTGAPEAMGYCHCNSCRSWSAAPVNAFTLWKPDNVRVTKGAEFIGHFMKTKNSDRQYCTKCGGHLMNNHPIMGLVDVYAATIRA